jgi:hypothetical protein
VQERRGRRVTGQELTKLTRMCGIFSVQRNRRKIGFFKSVSPLEPAAAKKCRPPTGGPAQPGRMTLARDSSAEG